MVFIAPIVEGHGEMEAVPILLRRMAASAGLADRVRVNPPIRVKAGSFLTNDAYFCHYVRMAAAKAAQEKGVVLILLDCEDDLPCRLGPMLLSRARAARGDVPYLVVLAHREFETWFVTAAQSLRGCCGLPPDLMPLRDTARLRDAKGWLGNRMDGGYDPITHQHAMARVFDLDQARADHSFKRFYDRIVALL